MSNDNNANVTLKVFDACDPVFDAGTEFFVNVEQSLKDNANDDSSRLQTSGEIVHLKVQGPQVRLQADDIVGLYPAPGSDNSPDEFLPHIALRRRTLPWERKGPWGNKVWLALILLKADELPGAGAGNWVRSTDINEMREFIKNPEAWKGLDDTTTVDADTTTVDVVDVPSDTLSKILPDARELPLLCHMRLVPESSAEARLDDDGDVAVVIGSRLPDAGSEGSESLTHIAFLVSLEYRDDLLPPPNPEQGEIASRKVPLIVLHHWSFKPNKGGDFEQVIRDIRHTPKGGVLRFGNLPTTATRFDKVTPYESIIDQQGYLKKPLGYEQTRANAGTYRGPLRPFPLSSGGDHLYQEYALARAPEEFENGDGTSPNDYAYAAAFELGRLLALSSQGILTDMQDISQDFNHGGHAAPREIDIRPEALQGPEWVINPPLALKDRWAPVQKQSLLDMTKEGLLSANADPGGIRDVMNKLYPEKNVPIANQILKGLAATGVQAAPQTPININRISKKDLAGQFTHVMNAAQKK